MAKRGQEDAAAPGEQFAAAAEARALEEYLTELGAIRATGAAVPETSYYPALANLFNAVGKTLKPQVRCVIHTKDQGAGIPDGGLFTADQFQRHADATPRAGQLPSRGAMEVKAPDTDVKAVAQSEQVKRYLDTYGIVLVSNLRDFLIVERGPGRRPAQRESFSLAADAQEFWRHKVAHPRATVQHEGRQFVEFLRRACLHAAPLGNPKDVAWFLASYARDALVRVERMKELPALESVRAALEQSLGMKFTAERGEHFFRSTLVQTIFYGVFSAWVLWQRENANANAKFDWRTAEWTLHVPFIRILYEEVAKPSQLGPLGLVQVLDWAAGVLNRVDRIEFFKRFQDEHAVQYFYEPFLEAYDPDLRKQLGVWYTPPEIVKYQVARVDTVLREDLDLPDGLADPNVVVLDPCCGTGAYLVEVLHRIAATLRDKGGDALVAADLKQAAMERVFGFEILPAPFVVSHLQLGLMLQSEGAPLSHEKGERAGVYLTNALTGWEPPKGPKQQLMGWAELQEERDAAENVKRHRKVLVVLGNPPYNAFAGVSPEEEQGLVEPYKKDLNKPSSEGGWGIRKFNLDDLYIRFFRLAERRIAEMTGKGVVSFISNHSWIAEPSFVVLREHLLNSFDKLWIENLHGNRKISEYAPDGRTSETVFAIRGFSVGIQQGVATSLWVKTGKPRKRAAVVRFRDDVDAAKAQERRLQLLETLNARRLNAAYARAAPSRQNRFSFRPENVAEQYNEWLRIVDLCETHYNGPVERRAGALISIDRDALESRIKAYFDPTVPDSEVAISYASLMMTGNRIVGPQAREKLLKEHVFNPSRIVRYPYKVFDVRWAYLANIRPLFSEPSPDLLQQRFAGNRFLITRDTADKRLEGPPFYCASVVCDYDSISGHARHVPLMVRATIKLKPGENGLFDGVDPHANLSSAARAYLAQLGVTDPDADAKTAGLIWLHALAIGYSPAYLSQNADGIRRDWPRIPLPRQRKRLEASAALGERIAALLDTEADVAGVTAGKLGPGAKAIAVVAKVSGGAIDPAGADLAVTSGWGHAGKGGVTMPAKGKLIRRNYEPDELGAIEAEAAARDTSAKEVLRLLGAKTCDVYLNDAAYWRNIPVNVWEYHVGGYQVIKKWLSYREEELLGRALRTEEVREVTDVARRIAAILLLEPQLDENYRRVRDASFDWRTSAGPGLSGVPPNAGPDGPGSPIVVQR